MKLNQTSLPRSVVAFLPALFLCVYLLCLPSGARANPLKYDPGLPDTLRIDSIRALTAGGNIQVPLKFFNDEQLQAMEVTVTHSSALIVFDSISFSGSRVAYLSIKGFSQLGNAITAYCLVANEPLIAAGSGIFGTLYCHTVGTIAPQLVPIDTITVVNVDKEYSNSFSDATSTLIMPEVRRGYINFQTSCCVNRRGNVDGDPGDVVDISDLSMLVDYLMGIGGTTVLPCPDEANIDGSPDGAIDIADLSTLVDYLLLGTLSQLPPCP